MDEDLSRLLLLPSCEMSRDEPRHVPPPLSAILFAADMGLQ